MWLNLSSPHVLWILLKITWGRWYFLLLANFISCKRREPSVVKLLISLWSLNESKWILSSLTKIWRSFFLNWICRNLFGTYFLVDLIVPGMSILDLMFVSNIVFNFHSWDFTLKSCSPLFNYQKSFSELSSKFISFRETRSTSLTFPLCIEGK